MAELPERASFEYLRKLAKDRLGELRRLNPDARLAAAQLAIAREHGFSSWRALKAEIDRRHGGSAAAFFQACEKGDITTLSELLATDRAAWLNERLRERGWNKHDVSRQGGPDQKSVQKIREGRHVREDLLEKLAKALSNAPLSRKLPTVNLLDIPQS